MTLNLENFGDVKRLAFMYTYDTFMTIQAK